MFEKKQYIVSSTFGVCMVEKITKLVVGREQQMEYYVLQSARDRSKKSYIPVEQHETILREPIMEEEAIELLKKMPINTNDFGGVNISFETARALLESGNPEKWAVGAQIYLQHQDELPYEVEGVLRKVWENFLGEFVYVLKKTQEEIRQMVWNQLK